jgi:hypothetical protein
MLRYNPEGGITNLPGPENIKLQQMFMDYMANNPDIYKRTTGYYEDPQYEPISRGSLLIPEELQKILRGYYENIPMFKGPLPSPLPPSLLRGPMPYGDDQRPMPLPVPYGDDQRPMPAPRRVPIPMPQRPYTDEGVIVDRFPELYPQSVYSDSE